MNNNPHLGDRKFIIGGFFILIIIVYIGRLFYLQIIDKSYEASAKNNAFEIRLSYSDAIKNYNTSVIQIQKITGQ